VIKDPLRERDRIGIHDQSQRQLWKLSEKEGKRYLVIDTTKEALTSAPGYQYDKASGKWVPEAK
jgi:hypothetical protein